MSAVIRMHAQKCDVVPAYKSARHPGNVSDNFLVKLDNEHSALLNLSASVSGKRIKIVTLLEVF